MRAADWEGCHDHGGKGSARTALLMIVLARRSSVAPFATDMYVPGFPAMADSLHTDSANVQLSMTTFLVGLALGQILFGPVSDSLGRRPVLLAGSAAFVVFSVACAVAPNVEVLIAARLLQGLAGAPGIVVSRAVFGVLLVLGVLGGVRESLPAGRRHAGGIGATFRAMAGLLGKRAVIGYVVVASFAGVALFGYIAGSMFVFQDLYGASETRYSLIFATNTLGMLAGATVFNRLAGRVRPRALLTGGVLCGLVPSAVLVVLLLVGAGGLVLTWVLLFLGQEAGREAAGAASALIGGGRFVFGAIASPLVGAFGSGSAVPMAAMVLIGFAGGVIGLMVSTKG